MPLPLIPLAIGAALGLGAGAVAHYGTIRAMPEPKRKYVTQAFMHPRESAEATQARVTGFWDYDDFEPGRIYVGQR